MEAPKSSHSPPCRNTNSILRFDGSTGAPLGTFVAAGEAGLSEPYAARFGPDGHLYVSSTSTDDVLRFDGMTGEPVGDGVFVAAGAAGLDNPRDLAWSPHDGHLYVASYNTDRVLRFDSTDGSPIGDGIFAVGGGLNGPTALAFSPVDGDLVVGGNASADQVIKYDGVEGFLVATLLTGSSDLNFIMFLQSLEVCPADIDGNDSVGFSDLLQVVNDWGPCP